MRPLSFVVSICALGLGSYWMLTHGPLRPEPLVEAAPGSVVVEASEEVVVVRPPSPPAGGAASPPASRMRPAAPTVRTEIESRSYAVTGRTPAEVLESLVAGGPRADGEAFFGITEASVDLQYGTAPATDGCSITDVEVVLRLAITLPEWAAPADADPDLGRDWARFRRALAAHEGHHRQLAEAGAEALHRAVVDLRRATCDEVREEARRRLERIEVEIAADHRRYDTETGHGRTEGAIWPVQD